MRLFVLNFCLFFNFFACVQQTDRTCLFSLFFLRKKINCSNTSCGWNVKQWQRLLLFCVCLLFCCWLYKLAYLKTGEYNVLLVDWSSLTALPWYEIDYILTCFYFCTANWDWIKRFFSIFVYILRLTRF